MHSNSDVKINVMHRSGNNWKWPLVTDHICYVQNDVFKKIDAPIVAGHRGQFKFSAI